MTVPAPAELTHESFAPLLNTWFRMQAGGDPSLEVELIAVEVLPPIPQLARRPFRLVFRSRDPDRHLPQGTYTFAHEVLGELAIFVVPRGADRARTGMIYDANFS